MELTQQKLKELLHYDPVTGEFTWLVARRGTACAGSKAGTVNSDGYIHIRLFGKQYKAHRLAWLYMTGSWPQDEIDHINKEKADNCWVNLREATRQQNEANKNLQSNNTSGFKGVYWNERAQKWSAQIRVNGKKKQIGLFDFQFDAMNSYILAANDLHGAYAHFGVEEKYPPTLQIISELYPDILQ